ncbi:MAG: glycosyltransferase [Nanoarchaeota archaeon]|nr:glycosyltransferase [Nanoarchaeota archaeon]
MSPLFVILNYTAWFIFVYIAVVWLLVLLQRRPELYDRPDEPTPLPGVTVLIPAYNEEHHLADTIRSVLSLDYPKKSLSVIVINDCSTDTTGKIAEEFVKTGRVTVLHNKTNKGKAASLNYGIEQVTTELLVCIDADSTVDSKALRVMVGHFRDSTVGSVTPALNVMNKKNLLEKIQHAEYILNAFMRKMLAFLDAVHVTPGVFSVYRTDAIRKIGGFAEHNLTEDMEIALRLHDNGYKITNEFSACSYTVCPSRWSELFRQRIRWYRGAIRNSIQYRRMFFNPRYGNLGMFMMPLNFLSILAVFGLLGTLLWNITTDSIQAIWHLSLVNWDIWNMLFNPNLELMLFSLYSTPLLFGALGVGLAAYLLRTSFHITNKRQLVSRPIYLIYLVLFPLILMVFWAVALMLELLRAPARW